MIRLLVVDDHQPFCERVRRITADSRSVTVSAEAGSREEALAILETKEIDVVSLDVSLGADNGLQVLKEIRHQHPGTPVLMVTMHAGAQWSAIALDRGASGFLRKEMVGTQIINAVETVAGGGIYDSESSTTATGTAKTPARS